MPTSYTSLLGFALPVTGELPGTWGDTVNDYITKYVDAAVAGAQTISGSQTAVTLSTTNGSTLSQAGAGATGSAQYAIINCTGNPAGLLTVTAPATSKAYLVINATSTNQSVKVVGSGPTTGVTIAAGRAALIAWNGSDFRLIASTDVATLQGLGTGVATALGTNVGSAGAFVVNGGALGTPSSGTVTNLTGTASININGTVGATTPNTGAFTSVTSTSASGILTRAAANQDGVHIYGRAGGTSNWEVVMTPTTLTADRTLTLPDNTGTILTTGATVSVANGGTGQTSYTDGQLLIGNTVGNTLTKATLTAGSGVSITNGNGSIIIAATGSGGTLTSVGLSFTGGLISVANSPITTSGTLALTVAGTSGGIPYFSSSAAWASSGVLASNALMVGGGAGAAPSTITTGTGVVTALGVNTGSSGAFVVNGGALGTPSSGTVTNLTGTASININGTVGATTPNTGAFTTLTSNDAVTFSATTQNIALGTSQTSGTWTAGGASQTGTITLDQSTKAHTLNIGTGATENATTKTINIGTAGVSGSTTAITIGSSVSGATSNITLNTSGNVTFQSVDAGATAGPILNLYRNSSSPAASDVIGQVLFQGKDSVGNDQTYAYIQSGIEDATSTSEDGNIQFFTTAAGTTAERMRVTAAGDVGIGTTVPGSYSKFVVAADGNGQALLATSATGSINQAMYNQGGLVSAKYVYGNSYTGGSILNVGANGTAFVQLANAPLAIGTQGVAQPILFGTNSTERMRLDSSGNLGLGVTPNAWVSGAKVFQAAGYVSFGQGRAGTSDLVLSWNAIVTSGTNSGTGYVYKNTGDIASSYEQNGGHRWYTAPSGTAGNAISFTQAMTLDASGNLLVGSTNASASAGLGAKVIANANGAYFASVTDSTTNGAHTTYNYYSTGAGNYRFYVGAAGTVFAVSTTISGISDQRLKENIQDIDVGLDKIMALKPRKFDWKPGKGKDKKGDRGWIAQEFEQVFPEMIDTWKDPAPEGEEPYKAVNADLIPILVKAIQELKAELDSVKAELAALKGA